MNLSESQVAALRQWAAAGATLSDLQTRLADEFGLRLSYMDVRFLVLDLGIELVEPKSEKTVPSADLSKAPEPPEPAQAPEAPDAPEPQEPAPGGSVRFEVSRLARPGFAATGTVTFSDGVTADWGVTARGELDLVPDEDHPDYRPSQEDARAFMVELRKAMMKMGMY
jgi:hypothetical protein